MRQAGFTLVELIVVVTILTILGTIGFISYNGYLLGVRDSNRTTQLQELANGLELYRTKNTLPLPDKPMSVKVNGNIIAYQGYMGQDQLDLIDYSKGGKDPKDGEYFTYYLSADRRYYQLLGYLEDANNQTSGVFNQAYAGDYTSRFPTVTGKKLGVLTEPGTNLPIQTLSISGGIDIATTTNTYIAWFSDKINVQGSGVLLQSIQYNLLGGMGIAPDCNGYMKGNSAALYGKDGIYVIQPSGIPPVQVYCDMKTDGGGWTRVKTGYSSWIPDAIKTKMTSAQEMMFSYDSGFTGKQHKYKITQWATPTDNYQKIQSINDFINIVLGSKGAVGAATRDRHTGSGFQLVGKNVGSIKDPCHPDLSINSHVAYTWRSFSVAKESASFYLYEATQFYYLSGNWYNYYYNTFQFQTQYCGSSADNVSYISTFTDVFIR